MWDGTPHAHAYATLEKGFKEFNLDCVSCHVTGYGKPGGSSGLRVAVVPVRRRLLFRPTLTLQFIRP